jgi:lysyl-tRNA synthetase class 2
MSDASNQASTATLATRLRSRDRWPERFATGLFGFAAFVVVITLVPPWHRFFGRGADLVSLLAFPVVPNLIYAALLAALAIGFHRRMRAAFWVGFIWWPGFPRAGSF